MNLRLDRITGAERIQEFGKLLNENFGLNGGQNFLDDFPVWDETLTGDMRQFLRVGVFSDDQLIASTGIRLGRLKMPDGLLVPIALIGAVATQALWREKGLASQMIRFGEEWAQESGGRMIFLWGGEFEFYQKLGFRPFGKQVRVPIASFHTDSLPQWKIEQGWTPGLFACLEKRQSGLAIHPSDRTWIGAHRNTQWFWLGDPQMPAAYAAYGRGIDLPNLVHEWGGEREAVFSLFGEIFRSHSEAQILGSPRHLTEYGIPFSPESIEPLCLAKVLRAPDLSEEDVWFWGLDGV